MHMCVCGRFTILCIPLDMADGDDDDQEHDTRQCQSILRLRVGVGV